MAIENMRSCGFRKVGGVYLVGDGMKVQCDRLPYPLHVCPVCNSGVKFSRGFSWLDFKKYAGVHQDQVLDFAGCIEEKAKCKDGPGCYLCNPLPEKYGLLFVGESFYSTPQDFSSEAIRMGISKRIAAVPHNFKPGETIVLLAHKKVFKRTVTKDGKTVDEYDPGIFLSFIPQRVEQLVWQRDAVPELLKDMQKRGITPVIIPDGDPDHDPSAPKKVDKERLAVAKDTQLFGSLRERLAGLKAKPGSPVQPVASPDQDKSDADELDLTNPEE